MTIESADDCRRRRWQQHYFRLAFVSIMQLRAKLFPCSILHLSIVLLAVVVLPLWSVPTAVHVSPLDLSFLHWSTISYRDTRSRCQSTGMIQVFASMQYMFLTQRLARSASELGKTFSDTSLNEEKACVGLSVSLVSISLSRCHAERMVEFSVAQL